MKNLTKSFLATLMLMVGFSFSTNASAQVDCRGLSEKIQRFSMFNISSVRQRCTHHNQTNSFGDWIDYKQSYIKRLEGVAWDGVTRYGDGRGNSSSNSHQQAPVQNIQKVEKVAKKSRGQSISESSGLYAVIVKYGMKDGLVKIKEYWVIKDLPLINLARIEKYLTSISWTVIEHGAEKFAMSDSWVKFLRA